MRALSARAATRCETAKSKRCRCRCGGLLHGSGRFAETDGALQLPLDDPHRALRPGERERDPLPPAPPVLPGQLMLPGMPP